MKFPKEYEAPRVQNLSQSSEAAWGQCNPGSVAVGEDCGGGIIATGGGTCTFAGGGALSCTTTGSGATGCLPTGGFATG